jgi:steroid 5-alpha reductase family enzyme
MHSLRNQRLLLAFIYLFSAVCSWEMPGLLGSFSLPVQLAIFTFTLAFLIFCFSVAFNNSSVFDPYWSVAPVLVVFNLLWHADQHWFFITADSSLLHGRWYGFPRIFFILILTTVWGSRLTWNFLRSWKGLRHEDWRYREIRNQTGKFYWLISFLGIHLFPALMVFLGSLSLYVVIACGIRPTGLLDLTALIVTGFAIRIEALADKQLHNHVINSAGDRKIIETGLWAACRHPNYLGEISFWWGLFLFALAANPAYWWVIAGPAAILLMFLFISIPLIEKRLSAKHPDYPDYRRRVGMLIPRGTISR